MSRTRPRTATLTSSPEDVEAQFYEALQQGRLDMLMACWADEDEVVCVHPGGQRLLGLAAIRAGFERLLAGGGLAITPGAVRRVQSAGCAVHSVLEQLTVADAPEPARSLWVVATNVYFRTAQGWRLVSHHASAAGGDGAPDAGSTPQLLH